MEDSFGVLHCKSVTEETLSALSVGIKDGFCIEEMQEKLPRNIQLLVIFMEKLWSKHNVTNDEKFWIETILYQFCGEFLKQMSECLKPLKPSVTALLRMCCSWEDIKNKYLSQCVENLNDVIDSVTNHTCTEEAELTSILLIICEVVGGLKTNCSIDVNVSKTLLKLCCDTIKLEVVSHHNLRVISSILIKLFQESDEQCVQSVWNCLKNLYSGNENIKLFIIMSSLLPFFASTSVIKETELWLIIQEGLLHEDPLTRKRALYIFKWLIDFITHTEEFIIQEPSHKPILFWHKNREEEFWSIWKTIIMVLEILEEKQLHVIQPYLTLFNDILNAVGCNDQDKNSLHFSWLLVMLRRGLSHESKPLQKWTLQYSLQLPVTLLLSEGYKFIFDHILPSFQKMFIFYTEDDSEKGSPPIMFKLLKHFIQLCIKNIETEEQLTFCEKILYEIGLPSYNDISTTYLTTAISSIELNARMTAKQLQMFKKFLFSKLPLFRKEYQRVIFHNFMVFISKNTEESIEVASILTYFLVHGISNDILTWNGKCWQLVVDFITNKNQSFIHDALKTDLAMFMSVNEKVTVERVVVLILVCSEIGNLSDVKEALHPIFDVVAKLNSNPYLHEDKINNALSTVDMLLYNIVNSDALISNPIKQLISQLTSLSKCILQYLKRLATEMGNLKLLEKCVSVLELYVELNSKSYDDALKTSLNNFFKDVAKVFHNIVMLAGHIVDDKSEYDNSYIYYLALRLLNCSFSFNPELWKNANEIYEIIICKTIQFKRQSFKTSSAAVDGKFSCEILVGESWKCLEKLMSQHVVKIALEYKEKLFNVYINDCDVVSNESILPLISFAAQFIKLFENDVTTLLIMIDAVYRIIMDRIQTDSSFWNIFKKCMAVIFHRDLLLNLNEQIQDKLTSICQKLIMVGEKKAGIVNLLIQQCIGVWNVATSEDKLCDSMKRYMNILIQLALFGPLRSKKEKPRSDLIHFLEFSGTYENIETLQSFEIQDQDVRVTLINFILNLETEKPNIYSFMNSFLKELLLYEKMITKNNTSYYPNSEKHRQKVRLWQMVLILSHKCGQKGNSKEMLKLFCETFRSTNQPSVRYFIEWCILLILIKDCTLTSELWSHLDTASEKKIYSVTSVFSICIQLAKLLEKSSFKQFVREAVPRILPWSQAQHMTSRILAQVALQTIWNEIVRKEHEDLRNECSYLCYCFALQEHNSSAVKHRAELLQHFIYSKFHPIKHFSLQAIFHGILTLTDYSADEYLDVKRFTYHEKITDCSDVQLKRLDEGERLLKEKSSTIDSLIDNSSNQLIDMQKKIMPWRIAPPTEDETVKSELSLKEDSAVSDLVLCAVLVEKIPNLGGLCRTAEIFGVGTLVVASHRYLQDINFKSLSVSAEKWLNIDQVLPVKLPEWLKQMKADGYHLVGVEQTANSKMIGKYEFQRKTVLLLGNEKTGIPVNLIQFLDDCVEIPQFGIIRSLNVHISGAIMVWEYCKQHMC